MSVFKCQPSGKNLQMWVSEDYRSFKVLDNSKIFTFNHMMFHQRSYFKHSQLSILEI